MAGASDERGRRQLQQHRSVQPGACEYRLRLCRGCDFALPRDLDASRRTHRRSVARSHRPPPHHDPERSGARRRGSVLHLCYPGRTYVAVVRIKQLSDVRLPVFHQWPRGYSVFRIFAFGGSAFPKASAPSVPASLARASRKTASCGRGANTPPGCAICAPSL